MADSLEIEWSEILRMTTIAPFRAHKFLDPNVGCLRIFPGITENSVRAFLSGPIKGVILETFGTGNAPDNRPEIIEAISKAVKRGIIIVNITQCQKGSVTDTYSTGHALIAAGVVSGRDMTTECALTKLSYLLSFPNYDKSTVRKLFAESLRGELTIPIIAHHSESDQRPNSWLGTVLNSTLLATTTGHREAVDKLLRPLLLHYAATNGDVDALKQLSKNGTTCLNALDHAERSVLHSAILYGQVEIVKWLVSNGASIHACDNSGHTAVHYYGFFFLQVNF